MCYSGLLPWYDQHKRVLPFRGARDPYAIWVSEIMLQQTRTETVAGYYTRFLSLFPTVTALAEAPEEAVLKAWEGLGYYSRARNLHRAAQVIASQYGGVFPNTYEAIRALPGVGDYTAAAVASIAFGLPHPAIDGNLTRVISRVHGIREDVGIPSVKRQIEKLATAHIDRQRPGDWNQALMDIGAMVCVPGTPDCMACPLAACCNAHAEDDADLLPVRAAAKPPVPVNVGVGIITCGDRVLMQRREAALLRGLWVFFLLEGDSDSEEMEKRLRSLGLSAAFRADLGEARHVFTHRIWNMRLYHFEAAAPSPVKGYAWMDAVNLRDLPLPTAMKAAQKAAEEILNAGTRIE
ncbi:MAG: A/G-specific adenine glycosylase [Clostridia bacterium]|nr:A/G-specific adenine glycosylase [Clostridia bacterium]